MISDCLKIGDEVVITIPKDSREWGYNPCPDGTVAVVRGFATIPYGRLSNFGHKPGIYVNREWVTVEFSDGRTHSEWVGRMDLVDKAEYQKRVAAFRKLQKSNPNYWRDSKDFIEELPETPFWEGDVVEVTNPKLIQMTKGYPSIVVVSIEYSQLNDKTNNGSKWPAYRISDKLMAGWYTYASEDDLKLLERGDIWKYYHKQPISFENIQKEAEFFSMLGHTDEVRNPANELYSWTKDQVLEAIQNGLVHGFAMASGFFGTSPRVTAIRFRDEELGKRVASATLEGFALKI